MFELQALPPEEAIAYFRQKGYAVGFDYRDVWQAQHQAAFTVAKAMQLDLLQDIRAEVDRALAHGTTLQDFQKQLIPTLQQKGWWGRQTRQDPLTGELRDVQLGSPRRLKVIYDTNLRTAHSEGQWERIQARKASFPYLQYDGGNSENPRLQHKAWDGLVLPVDDPFWQSHMPVKEWGCKCRVIPMTAAQLQRRGLEVGESPSVPTTPYINARTGEVQQIPAGVHPAFHYPPGGRRGSLVQHLVDKVEAAPAAVARSAIVDLVQGEAFADWYRQPAGNFPLAHLSSAIVERLGSKTSVLSLPEATLAKQLREQPNVTLDDYPRVQEAIDRGREILAADGALIYLLEEAGMVTVVKVTKAGNALMLTSLRRLSKAAARRDGEIQRLLNSAQ
ncbi:phage head morphogenesis protein [Stutzerimonas kunmingensis]|uniref:phage head morphogenesis protein n=1 Tax=Stutzerimonas kunmingensis TaxID=1211807 RepID=UPI00289CEB68|nr:phage minor head protein [Stutzerimonas kunmingensis]